MTSACRRRALKNTARYIRLKLELKINGKTNKITSKVHAHPRRIRFIYTRYPVPGIYYTATSKRIRPISQHGGSQNKRWTAKVSSKVVVQNRSAGDIPWQHVLRQQGSIEISSSESFSTMSLPDQTRNASRYTQRTHA